MNFSMRLATQKVLNEIKEGKNKNVLTSPLSTNIMLSMVATGSRGRTLEQLLGCLESKSVHELNLVSSKLVALVNGHSHGAATSGGVGGRIPSFLDLAQKTHILDTEAVDFIKQMMIGDAEVPSKRCGPMLSFANGVWCDRRYTLKPSFEEIAKNVFKADTRSVDFTKADKVVDEVNSWAKDRTNGLIKSILPHNLFRKETMLVLANALYFKGAWKEVFKTFMTRHEDFHLLNGETIKVPFMTKRNEKHFFGSFYGFKLLRLPYECDDDPAVKDNRRFSMYVYLPDENKGLEKLTQNFDSNPFKLLQHCTRLQNVRLSHMLLPKFKFSYEFRPADTMKELGLDLPFKNVGELTEMVDSDELFVSHILQKCFIEVNEEGSEASAITALLGDVECARYTSPPPPLPSFAADHPFLFLIKEEVSGVVVFAGAVLNPGWVD